MKHDLGIRQPHRVMPQGCPEPSEVPEHIELIQGKVRTFGCVTTPALVIWWKSESKTFSKAGTMSSATSSWVGVHFGKRLSPSSESASSASYHKFLGWAGGGVAAGGSNSESERTVLCGSSNSRPLRSQTSPKAVSLAGERYQYHTGLRSTTFVKDINDVPSARLRAAWGILGMALPSVPKQHLV